MVQGAEWNLRKGLVLYRNHIYVPNNPDLRCQIVTQHHDTKVAGHAGQLKTLELVMWSYWWPQMSCYIGTYCHTCDVSAHQEGLTHTHWSTPAVGDSTIPMADCVCQLHYGTPRGQWIQHSDGCGH
jgi:hypothetical protein